MPSEAGPDLAAALALAAELGPSLTSTSTLPGLVATLNARMKWLIPATQAALYLTMDDAPTYRRITRQFDTTEPLGENPVSWSLTNETGISIPDLSASEGYPPGYIPQGSGALMTMPLLGSRGYIGILVLHSAKAGAFAGTDRGLMHLITHQVDYTP